MLGTKKILVLLAAFSAAGICPRAGAQDTSCRDRCGLLKEELLRKCTADDGTIDAACMARVESEVARCLESCDGQPPPEPTCRDRCAALAEDLKARCVRPDGSVDEACLQEYLATVEACYAACGDPPPPPPPATCQERCVLLESDLLRGCRRDNGEVDAECAEKVKLTVAQCLESCDGQPPPEPTCRDRCAALAEDLKARCIGPDGTADEACLQEYLATVEACYAACGDPPPPPPPATCQDRCALLESDLLQGCRRDNGEVDSECVEKVKLTVAQCLESCDGQPPPPPAGCEEKCGLLKLELLARCVSPDGAVDPACLAEIEQTVMRCLGNCVEPPPPQPTCRERCEALASELRQKCIRDDGTVDEACLAEVARTVEGCHAACESPPPPQEPGCDENCQAAAAAAFERCREQGLPDDECRARSEEALKTCLAEKCPPAPPPPATCREKCERHSREVFDLCAKEGNSPEACEARSAEAFRRCATECSPDDGGTTEDPVPCDQDCVSQSEGLFKTCVAAGGSEEECRVRSDAILGLCLERCSGEVPCENRCALAAQLVLVGSLLAGLPEEEGRRIANDILARCVEGCSGGDTCPDRCQALAATAVRECLARGGSDAECSAKGEEVLGACEERCGGEAVPPCDVQCEEKAAAMVEEWIAQGLGPEEVAAHRDRFLEECGKLLGESCVEDAKAELTVFRGFRRGDATRDGNFDITDPIVTLAWLFQGGPVPGCEDAADANDDGRIDVSDPVAALGALFLGAGALPNPYARTGQDPTSDALTCAE